MRRSLILAWAAVATGLLVVGLGIRLLGPARPRRAGDGVAEPPPGRGAARPEPALAARDGNGAGLGRAPEEAADPSRVAAGGSAERGLTFFDLTVRDEAGTPVPCATVRYGPGKDDGTLVLDGSGHIVLPHRPIGSVLRLRVERPRDRDGVPLPLAPVDVEVPDTPDLVTEVPVLLPPARHITGVVVGPDGRGLAGATVWAQEGPGPRKSDLRLADRLDTAETDAEGRFDLGGRGAFAYDLIAFPRWDEERLLPCALNGAMGGASGVRIVARASVSARLAIIDPRGRPAANAVAAVERDPAEPAWATFVGVPRADDGGFVVLEGLDPEGSYELTAAAPGVALTRIRGWRPRDETIRLPPPRSLRGVVRDLTGRPVPRVHVDWVGRRYPKERPASGSGHPAFGYGETSSDGGTIFAGPDFGYVETDSEGAFALDAIPPGEIVVTYRLREDCAGPPVEQRVPPEGTVADQTLDVGKSISVRVDGPSTTRFSARVFVRTGTGAESWKCTHACDGTARSGPVTLRGTVPGVDYSLLITGESDHIAWRTGVRAGDDVAVALAPGLKIRGRVMSASVLDGPARVAVPGFASAFAERDGAFVIDGLPPGTWRVTASATSDGQPRTAEADVEAGEEAILTLGRPAAPK